MDFSEKELEDVIVGDDVVSVNGTEVEIIDRQFNLDGYKVDLVGKDFEGNIYLFELKKGVIDGNALSQVLFYMDYATYFNNDQTKKIYGVLIGVDITSYMVGAIKMLENVFYVEAVPTFEIEEKTYTFNKVFKENDITKENIINFNEIFNGSVSQDFEKHENGDK